MRFWMVLPLMAAYFLGCTPPTPTAPCVLQTSEAICVHTADLSSPTPRMCVWQPIVPGKSACKDTPCETGICTSSLPCETHTSETNCTNGNDPLTGRECGWFNDACAVAASPTDPAPEGTACAAITTQAVCDEHRVNGNSCLWQNAACTEISSCSDLTSEAACGQEGLLAAQCTWDGGSSTCSEVVGTQCYLRDCDVYSSFFFDNSQACESNQVNGNPVCIWREGTWIGGSCDAVQTIPSYNACADYSSQGTCEGGGNFCTWVN